MFTIVKASSESRKRDAKRNRYILNILRYTFHLSDKEVEQFRRALRVPMTLYIIQTETGGIPDEPEVFLTESSALKEFRARVASARRIKAKDLKTWDDCFEANEDNDGSATFNRCWEVEI